MTRAIALFIAVALLAGCKGSSPLPAAVDPFGRTTVEPPATGSIGGQPPGPAYYANPPQVTMPPAGATGAPPNGATGASPVAPAAGGSYQPPDGSFQFQGEAGEEPRPLAASRPGDRVSIPVDARDLSKQPSALAAGPNAESWSPDFRNAAPDSSAGAPPRTSGVELAGNSAPPERYVRTIEPRPGQPSGETPASLPSAGQQREPDRLPSSDGVINIMDLPPAGAANQPRANPGSAEIVLASATEVVEDSPSASSVAPNGSGSDSFSRRARHGHAPDYGWLRGRLEYSQIDRRWKLRYIPIDGDTDDFGGSVLISNPSTLSGCERGDYVEIHGRLDTAGVDQQHFTPEFEVAELRRLGD